MFTSTTDDAASRIARAVFAAKQRAATVPACKPFTLADAAAVIRAQLEIEFPAAKKTPRVNGRDELFDALAIACGCDLTSMTRNYAKMIATAKRDILEATPDCTPAEIARRGAAYRKRYKDAACTPMALANHWPEFGESFESRTRTAKADIYVEPPNWRQVLKIIGKSWDDTMVAGFLSQSWHELSPTVRQEILKGL